MACLEILEAEGRVVEVHAGGVLHIAPVDGLTAGDRLRLSDLKPELVAWLAIPSGLWPVIQGNDPDVTLDGLRDYREALDAWEAFTQEERGLLLPHKPTREDLIQLAGIKAACMGEVVEVASERA